MNPESSYPQTQLTELNLGNVFQAGSGNQQFDGNTQEIETVDYS
ncbi:hypothetical protein RintRC_4915 [Richelia intracellularis]|nr:hypothetical protein RintRC_4915 [Richelia intracellularis]